MTCERSSGGCKNQNVEKLEQLPWDGEMLATKHANSEQEVKRKTKTLTVTSVHLETAQLGPKCQRELMSLPTVWVF